MISNYDLPTADSTTSASEAPGNPSGIVPFSRRTFFGAAATVGALTFLGSFLGGRGLAFADEAGDKQFVIYVLSREEVPIMALDVSSSSPAAIARMSITLTSKFNGESLTVITDDKGFAPANVRALSYQFDDDSSDVYNFWASIDATHENYRAFSVGDYFVEAGTPTDDEGNRPNTIQIPSQPVGDQPYLRMLTLDGSDIQYAQNQQAEVWSGNTMNHDLAVEVVTPRPGQSVHVSVMVNGVERATQTLTSGTSAPYGARATFTRPWLQEIAVGDTLSVSFAVDGGDAWEFTSPLKFGSPVLFQSASDGGYKQDVPFSPGIQATSDPTENFCPIPGFLNRPSDSVCISIPKVPMTLFCDTKGRFGFTATLFKINFIKYKDGKDVLKPEEAFQTFRGLSGQKAWDSFTSSFNKSMDNFKETYSDPSFGKDGKLGVSKATSDINVNFLLDVMGIGTVETLATKEGQPNHFTADLAFRPAFNASASYTLQVNCAGIPLIIAFDASFYLKAEIAFGMQFDDFFKNVACHYHIGGTPIYSEVFLMRLEFGVSLGIGIAGVLSASIRAYAYLNGEFTFQQVDDKPFPHNVMKLGADADVVLQVVFFKKTFNITNYDPKIIFDNWEDSKASLDVPNFSEFPGVSADEMELVRDCDLQEGEVMGRWMSPSEALAANAAGAASSLQFGVVTALSPNVDLRRPRASDVFGLSGKGLSAVNGLVPVTQIMLYQDCFSNPRLRIIHTDAKSFSQDRAFMVRVLTADIEVPGSTSVFASGKAQFQGAAFDGSGLAVDAVAGNYFVKPADFVSQPANTSTVPRTRVAVCEWNTETRTWDNAHIVEFTVPGEIYELDRLNSHDVDFDVDFYGGKLIIAITSLQRPEDSTSIADYEAKQYLSVVHYDIDQHKVVAAGSTFALVNTGLSLFHPHILMQKFDATGGNPTDHCVVYSYACRYNDQGGRAEAYLAATVFDDMTSGFEGHRISNPTIIECDQLVALSADSLVTGSFEVACPDRGSTKWDPQSGRWQTTVLISWSHAKSDRMNAISMVFSQTFSIVIAESGSTRTFTPYVTQHDSKLFSNIPFVAKLGRMNQRALFSFPDVAKTTNQKTLKMITLDPDTLQLSTLTDKGQTDKTQYFSSFNGSRLYCVRTIQGTAPAAGTDSVAVIQAGGRLCDTDGPFNTPAGNVKAASSDVALYQLLEARWVGDEATGSYYDFYPIAQIDFIPDNIGVIAASQSYTHFTFAQVTDIDKNLGNIYQVDVPVVLSARLSGAAPTSPFAAPGDTCWYACEIANVGNAPITAITMRVVIGGKTIDATYADLAAFMCDAPDDAHVELDADGAEQVTEGGMVASTVQRDALTAAGILWPGRRRTFQFKFTVPEGLQGNETVDVSILAVEDRTDDAAQFGTLMGSDASSSANDAVPFMAKDAYVLGASALFDTKPILQTTPEQMDLAILGDTVMSEFDVGTANYAKSGGSETGNSGKGGSSSKPTAKTGDSFPFMAVAAAVAAGAAGVTAKKLHDRESDQGRNSEG